MSKLKIAGVVITASVIAICWLFLGGLFAWGYFSSGWEHYVAAALASPFWLANILGVRTEWQPAIGVAIMFLASVPIAVGCLKFADGLGRRRA
jgi:hypothetical protein